ncbi:MAG: hypothetical protein SFX18_09515 [Pirellulales bacterium]|nr:hypothetical protein [Pirellulales bacterium]
MTPCCASVTAASPLLGPSLRIIRSRPLARLGIGYRIFCATRFRAARTNQHAARQIANLQIARQAQAEQLKQRPPVAQLAPPPCRLLPGELLQLERMLVGGNQNEGLPLANWRIACDRQKGLGNNWDCEC